MTKEQLITIFGSNEFSNEVRSPYIYLFTGEYPDIARGYYRHNNGNITYVDYDISSSETSAYSLVIEVAKGGKVNVQFDTDDGMAKNLCDDLENDTTVIWERF